MPVTFLAHQGPFLPIARRWPNSVDGLAMTIGTMAPDLVYVLQGSRLQMWAHVFPALLLACVPIGMTISWLVSRILAPVVPDHIGDLGEFHVRDYRGLAIHRFVWWKTALWAQLGALSHVALDSFTHEWGWFAQNWEWYRVSLTDTNYLGARWTVFRVLQVTSHVVLSAWCLVLLHRYGRQRWMKSAADQVPPFRPTTRSRVVLWGCTLVGFVLAEIWVITSGDSQAIKIMRQALGVFVGLLVGSLIVRYQAKRPQSVVNDAEVGHNGVVSSDALH